MDKSLAESQAAIASHTPGPWSVNGMLGNDVHIGTGPFSAPIAAAYSLQHMRTTTLHANARLIAAAPDLLEALIKLSNEVMGSAEMARPSIGNTNANCLLQRAEEARAAIKKARGQ